MGIPMSLLWLAGVLLTRKVPASTAAIISLVVLLPTEPVMATTLAPIRFRASRAMSPSAVLGSETMMAGKSPTRRLHSTAAAPFSRAAGMNSWPSLAPCRVTNS